MMKKLPAKEQEAIEIEERKMKRLELQEIKENLWGNGEERKIPKIARWNMRMS